MIPQEDLSIVLIAYNHQETIEFALKSILSQRTRFNFVIYCLDDASSDATFEIIERYRKDFPNIIRSYRSPYNLGQGKKSIYFHQPPANGRYWCLLEADDYWISSDKIEKQLLFLDLHHEFVGCSSNTIVKNELSSKESIIQSDKPTFNIYDLILLKHKFAFYCHTSGIIWRRRRRDKTFFMPEKFAKDSVQGDVQLMHLMLHEGHKFKNIESIISCYRVTGTGLWSGKSNKEKEKFNSELPRAISKELPLLIKLNIVIARLLVRALPKAFYLRLRRTINE